VSGSRNTRRSGRSGGGESPRGEGRLSIVSTPIGNLEDLTLRALRTLREADAILAENTRRTRGLCLHHGIATPLRSFHAHTSPAKVGALVEELREGAHLALVSDAGTPLVSDPGTELVRAAAEAGVTIEPIPGPSAPIAALVASGLAAPGFAFLGFLPRSGGRRRKAFALAASLPLALVIFEAPTRLAATLADLAGALGGSRRAAVCRELTKAHEEVARGTLDELRARYQGGTRGEITIVVEAPAEAVEPERPPIEDEVVRAWLRDEGLSTRQAAQRLAEAEGGSRRDAYQRVLAIAASISARGR
jgi:16S rRNA (cytidine1402-2'-O)-methyltransferase